MHAVYCVSLNAFLKYISFFCEEAKLWKIFIYPTDTVYGIGCIVTKEGADTIYTIKKRDAAKPFSIIAPTREWIETFFHVPQDFSKTFSYYLNQYHGVTFLLRKKDSNWMPFLGKEGKVGVRILKHDFQEFVSFLWMPFITTSVNISWTPSVKRIEDIPLSIQKNVDVIVYGWECFWIPSVLIDIEENKVIFRSQ